VAVKKTQKTWYVSIYIPTKEKHGHYSRRSQTFACESDAKRFAEAKIAAGAEVSAGTLNPVVPKRIVGPSQIEQWLSEETSNPASTDPPTRAGELCASSPTDQNLTSKRSQ
jgi:hypothetical protein